MIDNKETKTAPVVEKLGGYELNNIYCGECSDMLDRLPDNCIDLTVTSPPYGKLRLYNGFVFPFESIAQQLFRVTKEGSIVVWVVGDETIDGSETLESFRQALYFKDCGFNLPDTMIYKVNGTGAKGSRKTYWQSFDFMFVFSKGTLAISNLIADKKRADNRKYNTWSGRTDDRGGRSKYKRASCSKYVIRDNVWEYTVSKNNSTKDKIAHNHSAIFPEALARDHIISWSNPGDIILDPMIGSGTTAKMAIETGRRFLGFDISQKYVDLAKRRIQSARVLLGLDI